MTRIARAGALLALALLTALALAGPATAKKKPRKPGKGAESAKVLPKHWSKQHKAKGARADPDDDGLSSWGEYRSHTKPRRADTDKDGVGDAEEDYDRDGFDNGSELVAGTDPGRKDTDRDGTRDGAEDADKDGLSNAAEDETGNHPRKRDTDGDGILDDAPDKCVRTRGIPRFGGCPPELRSAPRITYTNVGGTSLRVTGLFVDDVPKGARVEARCQRCGGRKVTRRATRKGTIRLSGFVGRIVPAGDRIEIRVTLGKTGRGQYRHGAIGKYFRWPIKADELGRRVTRCLQPGSRKPSRCR